MNETMTATLHALSCFNLLFGGNFSWEIFGMSGGYTRQRCFVIKPATTTDLIVCELSAQVVYRQFMIRPYLRGDTKNRRKPVPIFKSTVASWFLVFFRYFLVHFRLFGLDFIGHSKIMSPVLSRKAKNCLITPKKYDNKQEPLNHNPRCITRCNPAPS